MFNLRFLILSGRPDTEEKTGWTTRVAESLRTIHGLDVIEGCPVDELSDSVYLADIVLIGDSDPATCEALIARPSRDKALVFTSLHGTSDVMRELFRLGFADVGPKTDDAHVLMTAIVRVLNLRWARAHHRRESGKYDLLLKLAGTS